MHVVGPSQLRTDHGAAANPAALRAWPIPLLGPVEPSLARIVPAINETAEADIFAVPAVHAGDAGNPVPAGAMRGRNVAVDKVGFRCPLNDAAGVVSGQAPAGPCSR